MSQTDVQVPPDSTGKKVDAFGLPSGNVRQGVVLGSSTVDAAVVDPTTTAPTKAVYGLPTRDVPQPCSTFHLVSLATTNANAVKASAGQVYAVRIFAKVAHPIFVKLYDKASAPSPAADTVKASYGCQADLPRDIVLPKGIDFTLGIAVAIVTGIGDTDNTAVGAGDVSVEIEYV